MGLYRSDPNPGRHHKHHQPMVVLVQLPAPSAPIRSDRPATAEADHHDEVSSHKPRRSTHATKCCIKTRVIHTLHPTHFRSASKGGSIVSSEPADAYSAHHLLGLVVLLGLAAHGPMHGAATAANQPDHLVRRCRVGLPTSAES